MPKHKETSHHCSKKPSHPPPNAKAIARERARALMSESFLDNNPMDDTPPRCLLADFQRPHLRRCPYDLNSVTFTGRVNLNPPRFLGDNPVDGGLDGYNWKIRFEKGGPTYILKLVGRVQSSSSCQSLASLANSRLLSSSGMLKRPTPRTTSPLSASARMPPCSR